MCVLIDCREGRCTVHARGLHDEASGQDAQSSEDLSEFD